MIQLNKCLADIVNKVANIVQDVSVCRDCINPFAFFKRGFGNFVNPILRNTHLAFGMLWQNARYSVIRHPVYVNQTHRLDFGVFFCCGVIKRDFGRRGKSSVLHKDVDVNLRTHPRT